MCFPSSNGIKDIFNEEQDNTVTIYHLQEMHIRRKINRSGFCKSVLNLERERSHAPEE